MNDLYHNAGEFIYLRINNIYYKRIIGKGWLIIPESHAPNVDRWNKLHEKQREAYATGLLPENLWKG